MCKVNFTWLAWISIKILPQIFLIFIEWSKTNKKSWIIFYLISNISWRGASDRKKYSFYYFLTIKRRNGLNLSQMSFLYWGMKKIYKLTQFSWIPYPFMNTSNQFESNLFNEQLKFNNNFNLKQKYLCRKHN